MVREPFYAQISQDEAKLMMQDDDGHVIVDVRRPDEYAAGHIPGAILIPNEEIGTEEPAELPDKRQIILVYCRTGRRSKEAAQKLADMGYVNVYEFGGIEDWTGDIVTDEETDGEEDRPEDIATGDAVDGEEARPVDEPDVAIGQQAIEDTEEDEGMILKINGEEFQVEWEDNESVEALKKLCPLTVEMSMYGGFEQVGSLGSSLPRSDAQTTTDYGDIVLYSGNQIVIFYGTNSWAYTRLGHITADKETMEATLSNGDVTVELVNK
jgi:rhodanese-related sulfurtransferase